jgi:hypothetical protein
MKNPITILLITVHLLAYTDIVQIFKIPNLFLHYQEHHSIDQSISFIDFLELHYVKCNNGKYKDDREDMKLPFKLQQNHINAQALVAFQPTIVSEIESASYHNLFYSYHSDIIPSIHTTSLLRPPISLI